MISNLPPLVEMPPTYAVDDVTGYVTKKNRISLNKGFTVEKKQQFIALLEESLKSKIYNEGAICKQVGVSKLALSSHLRFDVKLRREYAEIIERFIDMVEEVALNQALTNPRAAAERKFILERRRPEVYAAKSKQEAEAKTKTNDPMKHLMDSLKSYEGEDGK